MLYSYINISVCNVNYTYYLSNKPANLYYGDVSNATAGTEVPAAIEQVDWVSFSDQICVIYSVAVATRQHILPRGYTDG